jgi:AraC-like DNA-binding protein
MNLKGLRVAERSDGGLSDRKGEPLDLFPVCRTSDPEVFENTLLRIAGAESFTLAKDDDFKARLNLAQLQDISLGFSAFGSQATITFRESREVRQQFALSGAALVFIDGRTLVTDAAQSVTIASGRPVRMDYGKTFEQIILRIKPEALVRILGALFGMQVKSTIDFAPVSDCNHPPVQSLRQLIMFLCEQLNTPTGKMPALVLRELEQTIMLSFLHANRHTFSHLLDLEAKDGAPFHVRHAEEFIEANWDRAITIEQLSDLTNVGARTLVKLFLKHRGYTPRVFAKQVRLNHAKAMLTDCVWETSVTAVAFACGFGNLGHFAKDYLSAFGELPSDTLTRQRRMLSR